MRFFITFTLFVLSLTGCNSIDVEDIQEGDIIEGFTMEEIPR